MAIAIWSGVRGASCRTFPDLGGRWNESEQLPSTGNAFHFVGACFLELQSRPLDQVECRRGHEDLVRTADSHNTRSRMDGKPAGITTNELYFARVDAHPNGKVHLACGEGHRGSTPHRTCGAVENGEETVTGGLHLTPSENVELVSKTSVVDRQEVAPGRVAHPLEVRPLSRRCP